jgi:hypothetical protein
VPEADTGYSLVTKNYLVNTQLDSKLKVIAISGGAAPILAKSHKFGRSKDLL